MESFEDHPRLLATTGWVMGKCPLSTSCSTCPQHRTLLTAAFHPHPRSCNFPSAPMGLHSPGFPPTPEAFRFPSLLPLTHPTPNIMVSPNFYSRLGPFPLSPCPVLVPAFGREMHAKALTRLTAVTAIVHEAPCAPDRLLHLLFAECRLSSLCPPKVLPFHFKVEETEAQGGYLAQDLIAYKLPAF